jgi:hypothetical protein
MRSLRNKILVSGGVLGAVSGIAVLAAQPAGASVITIHPILLDLINFVINLPI